MSRRIYKINKKNFRTRKQIVYRGGGEGEPPGAVEPSAPPMPAEEELTPSKPAEEPSAPPMPVEEESVRKEEEEELPEVEVKEPTGFIKPMAYLALGIVESGSALAVRMMARILKIDITGKDAGKLLKEFNISLENSKVHNYYAEKILDCFLTLTVPIYIGCPNIGDYYDKRGIIFANSGEDVINICNTLSNDKYYSLEEYYMNNYKLSKFWLKYHNYQNLIENYLVFLTNFYNNLYYNEIINLINIHH
jgi:hypothetical protein